MTQRELGGDPYVRAVAIHALPCLGAFSPHAQECSTCWLHRECLGVAEMVKAALASSAISEASARIERDARVNACADELEASQRFARASRLRAQRDTMCARCSRLVPQGEECYWVEEEGVFHEECLREAAPRANHGKSRTSPSRK